MCGCQYVVFSTHPYMGLLHPYMGLLLVTYVLINIHIPANSCSYMVIRMWLCICGCPYMVFHMWLSVYGCSHVVVRIWLFIYGLSGFLYMLSGEFICGFRIDQYVVSLQSIFQHQFQTLCGQSYMGPHIWFSSMTLCVHIGFHMCTHRV